MKKLSTTITACLLAIMIAMISPFQVFAQTSGAGNANNEGKYISEVKIGMGKTAGEAAEALAGYTILSDKNGYVDLNTDAGGGIASKGEKVVYLGYKTTDDEFDAISDLAVMNMKGGYDTVEYDDLFGRYISEQIEPFVNSFAAALEEYRANYRSKNDSNRKRAAYIHDALNKFIDDDTGKGLGDLLLNRTKYEIGGEAYEALSDMQKQNTADIVTILAQANGKATLTIENLIARAADTADNTWVDRFAATTYQDLLDEVCDETGMLPTDAGKELDRLYQDDARKILVTWNDLRKLLADYDEYSKFIDTFDFDEAEERLGELESFINNFDETKNTQLELLKAMTEQLELSTQVTKIMNAIKIAGVHDYLEQYDYGNGTLLDFFSRPSNEVKLAELYPLSASLSEGQKAGLDFVSLLELITIAATDGADYSDEALEDLEEASIYEGVDRAIYKKGGVGLTTAARRKDAALQKPEEYDMFSTLTITSLGVSGATFLAFAVTDICRRYYNSRITTLTNNMAEVNNVISQHAYKEYALTHMDTGKYFVTGKAFPCDYDLRQLDDLTQTADRYNSLMDQRALAQSRSSMCKYLEVGLGVALVILTAYSVYSTYTDLAAHYNVAFTPIPHYMVDEKDITAYNAKGEKEFIKNQRAYYKAVECNRTSSDEMYGKIDTCADLNGDVGQQWLALYAVKNPAMQPILADSLLPVIGYDGIPANYFSGIHMFGSDTAFDLNNHMYVWNGDAPAVYVYFKVDDTVKRSAVGSIIADGEIALVGGFGIIMGAAAALAVMSLSRKKKEEKEQA